MNADEITFIEGQIGYTFKNKDLLWQAFIRRTYSAENGGECNEVLEFIGDKVLDFVVVKLLADEFGYMAKDCDDYNPNNDYNEFICEYRENKLTELKKQLVEKQYLSGCIDRMDLSQFLIMGKSDIKQNAGEQPSVKEDLFEALLGAIAIDCQWDAVQLEESAHLMLNPEEVIKNGENHNYVGLIQEWCERDYGGVPLFEYEKRDYSYSSYITLSDFMVSKGHQGTPKGNQRCILQIRDDVQPFYGYSDSKTEARKEACELAYEWLKDNDMLYTIQDELENPNQDEAIGQLEILARRGYFSIPAYDYQSSYDENGNPRWKVKCSIKEINKTYSASAPSKKIAKKTCAYKMLKYVLENC